MKTLKLKYVVLIITAIILADQILKIWIKTSYENGEETKILGLQWFRLHYIENAGMAWNWKLGHETGKTILTLFRLFAVLFGTWYLGRLVKQEYTKGFIICAALIYAGALGNLIDSMFYGVIFDKGLHFDPAAGTAGDYVTYSGVAQFSTQGYSTLLHGSVVDMFYFPIIKGHFPSWMPWVGGDEFEFFNAIFNIADASISVGVITLLIFYRRFYKRKADTVPGAAIETNASVNDNAQVL